MDLAFDQFHTESLLQERLTSLPALRNHWFAVHTLVTITGALLDIIQIYFMLAYVGHEQDQSTGMV